MPLRLPLLSGLAEPLEAWGLLGSCMSSAQCVQANWWWQKQKGDCRSGFGHGKIHADNCKQYKVLIVIQR